MLERKASAYLGQWKRKRKRNKRALLVTGARQTGKTYSIRQFGKAQYESFAEINFLEDKSAAAIFEGASDADAIVSSLAAHTGVRVEPGKTLIYFDEIQECVQAREAVRILVKDGKFDCIESGFMVTPAYYEETYAMHPLDFEEFLSANAVRSTALDYVRDCFKQEWEVSGSVHEMMNRLFRYYVAVGGMPEVVQTYLDTHDMKKVIQVQKKIVELYRQDIEKMPKSVTRNDKAKMSKILDFIPIELNKSNKRFLLADIAKSARMERYENSLNRLADTGMTLPCYHVSEPKYPLKNTEKRNLFKLFFVDSGLLCAMFPDEDVVQSDILQNRLAINRGSILENTFAQILAANGYALRYFSEKNKGELDFLIQKGKEIIPVEIRSGNSYKEHSALNFILNQEKWKLQKGIVFCDKNIEKDGKILYLPWYMIMFLKD